LDAFDIHHEHDETGWPHCLDPLDLRDRDGRDRLEALTHDGECRVYAEVKHDVTIWTTAGSREKVAAWRAASDARRSVSGEKAPEGLSPAA
jgi:hypothetical protein